MVAQPHGHTESIITDAHIRQETHAVCEHVYVRVIMCECERACEHVLSVSVCVSACVWAFGSARGRWNWFQGRDEGPDRTHGAPTSSAGRGEPSDSAAVLIIVARCCARPPAGLLDRFPGRGPGDPQAPPAQAPYGAASRQTSCSQPRGRARAALTGGRVSHCTPRRPLPVGPDLRAGGMLHSEHRPGAALHFPPCLARPSPRHPAACKALPLTTPLVLGEQGSPRRKDDALHPVRNPPPLGPHVLGAGPSHHSSPPQVPACNKPEPPRRLLPP